MQIHRTPKKWRVGIDLSPASRLQQAPGTAVHVSRQLTALFKLDPAWEWVPVAESDNNPLLDQVTRWNPSIIREKSYWRRAVFCVGSEWRRRGCDLGFATAFFTPWIGIPVVTNFFDGGMFTKEYARSWASSGKGWNFKLNKTLGIHALWRSKQIYTLSEYWKNFLGSRFPSLTDKLIVTPCGVEPPKSAPMPHPQWSSNLKRPFFLFAGAFSDNKNQFRLIELWARLQSTHTDLPGLVLPGPCSDAYAESRIRPMLRLLPRPEDVVLPGVVSDSELSWAFQNALAYLQPSYMEGFGMPIIEAMSYGLPVACSDTTCLPETAGGASLHFTPSDLNSIEKCVLTLWRNEILREKLRGQGLVRSSQFTWERNAQTVASNIELILRKNSVHH